MARPIKVDFSNTEDKGFYVSPGKYTVKCTDITQEEGSAAPYLKLKLEVMGHGLSLFHNCTLKPDALWNLKQALAALLGKDVPKSVVSIDIDKLIGRVCTAHIADREYNGKVYSNVTKLEPYTAASEVAAGADDLDKLL